MKISKAQVFSCLAVFALASCGVNNTEQTNDTIETFTQIDSTGVDQEVTVEQNSPEGILNGQLPDEVGEYQEAVKATADEYENTVQAGLEEYEKAVKEGAKETEKIMKQSVEEGKKAVKNALNM